MRISFSWGATRFVLLIGGVVIKIARLPNPFRSLLRLIEHQKNGEVRERLLVFGCNPLTGAVTYLFYGVVANRLEAALWQESHNEHLVPTRFSLFGIMNLQDRGESITQEELDASHPFRTLLRSIPTDTDHDLEKAENFCRYKGHICLADYGSKAALVLFSRQTKQLAPFAPKEQR
jgi:hypothetical protein